MKTIIIFDDIESEYKKIKEIIEEIKELDLHFHSFKKISHIISLYKLFKYGGEDSNEKHEPQLRESMEKILNNKTKEDLIVIIDVNWTENAKKGDLGIEFYKDWIRKHYGNIIDTENCIFVSVIKDDKIYTNIKGARFIPKNIRDASSDIIFGDQLKNIISNIIRNIENKKTRKESPYTD